MPIVKVKCLKCRSEFEYELKRLSSILKLFYSNEEIAASRMIGEKYACGMVPNPAGITTDLCTVKSAHERLIYDSNGYTIDRIVEIEMDENKRSSGTTPNNIKKPIR